MPTRVRASPSKPLVIGLTGTFGAGKDAAQAILARYYESKGLHAVSTGTAEELRAYCREHGYPLDRPTLQRVATDVRETLGTGYFGKRCVDKIKKARPRAKVGLITAFRHVGEVNAVRKAFGKNFVLIAIDAPALIRYKRATQRARAGEQRLTFAQFKESQEKEMQGKGGGQQIAKVMDMADRLLWNNSTLATFAEDLRRIADELEENWRAGRAVLVHPARIKRAKR